MSLSNGAAKTGPWPEDSSGGFLTRSWADPERVLMPSEWAFAYYAVLASYAAASVCGVVRLMRRDAMPVWVHRVLALVGVLLHMALIAQTCGDADADHLFNSPFHKVLLITWASASAALAVDLIVGVPSLGAAALPLVTGAVFALRFLPKGGRPLAAEVASSGTFVGHVLTIWPSFGVFFVGAITGGLYLAAETSIKRRREGWLWTRLPPLARLERGTGYALLIGFAFFTAALITGLYLTRRAPDVRDPKLYSAAAVWALIAAAAALRLARRLKGTRVVWAAIFCFVAVVGQSILVRHVLAGT